MIDPTQTRTHYPYRLNVSSALKNMGFDLNCPCRGTIIVRLGVGNMKRYAFRYRKGDGHVLTRWGRVDGAECVAPGVFVFTLEQAYRSGQSTYSAPMS